MCALTLSWVALQINLPTLILSAKIAVTNVLPVMTSGVCALNVFTNHTQSLWTTAIAKRVSSTLKMSAFLKLWVVITPINTSWTEDARIVALNVSDAKMEPVLASSALRVTCSKMADASATSLTALLLMDPLTNLLVARKSLTQAPD